MRCSLFVVCRLAFGVRCLLIVVRCLLFDVFLFVGCLFVFAFLRFCVVCCLLFVG